uniref:Uncharacterized protein n=1 Tax=uncultured Caudovirales phage TaxID=2100421 RepID=A0A6J5KV44_9CAUD|nr:hypothetical protein UFOVP88_22 [uncultured Caudovirales phage]
MSSFSNNFVPTASVISNITNANPCLVTTVSPHGYDNNLLVRIFFPPGNNCGMSQINGMQALLTVASNVSFTLPINSIEFDAFNPAYSLQYPQAIPTGEIGYTFTDAIMNNDNIIPEL